MSRRLPFTTKADLRETYPFGMFAVPMEQVARIHASSRHHRTPDRRRLHEGRPRPLGGARRPLAAGVSGIRPGMKVHNAYGYGLFTGGLGAHAGIEELGATVIPMSGGQTARQVQLIRDFEPDAILCTPSYLLTIADAMEEAGIDPRSTSLQGRRARRRAVDERDAATSSSSASASTRVDIYGLSEVMGPGVGNECLETKDGPHIWEDHFLPEVIDGETGERLPDGEMGELVFTSLTKEAFPVIRYRTRDLTRLLPGTARPGMRRIEKITGRNDDMIILRGVNLFPTQIEEIVLGIEQLTPHFILELTRSGTMDDLTVRIERHPDLDVEACEAATVVLAQRIKEHIGSTVDGAARGAGRAAPQRGQVQAGLRPAQPVSGCHGTRCQTEGDV